jgi:hypothetical protein
VVAIRNRKHLVVQGEPLVERFRRHPAGGGSSKPPVPAAGRAAHARALAISLREAMEQARSRRDALGFSIDGAVPGIFVEFEAIPDWELEGLENRRGKNLRQQIEVRSVRPGGGGEPERAVVFVPEGKIGFFIERFEKYALATPKRVREHRYENMGDRIALLRLASLRALWSDDQEVYPKPGQTIWWEIWLRRTDGEELGRFHQFAERAGISQGERLLLFDDRIVLCLGIYSR